MLIQFERLEIDNFRSIKSGSIDIREGKHLIIGITDVVSSQSNGAGKSSIFEALVWCIYKKDIRSSDPSYNRQGDCRVSVSFNNGKDHYTITRYHKDSKYKNGVFIEANGSDISNRLPSLTDQEISKIIPISYDVFVSTIVVLQGFPINISRFTPTSRKTLIENSIGFSLWDKLRKFFGSYSNQYEDVISKIRDKINNMNNRLVSINTEMEVLSNKNNEDVEYYNEQLKEKKTEYEKVSNEVENVKSLLNEIDDNSINMYMENRLELNKIESEINNINRMLQNRSCPTCNRPYPEENFKIYEDKLVKLNRFHNKCKSSCEELESIKDRHNKLEQDHNILMNKLNMVNNSCSQISNKLDELNSYDKSEKITNLKEESKKISNEINVEIEKLSDNGKRKEHIEYLDSILLPSSDFRSEMLTTYVNYINEIIDNISGSIFSDIKISLVVDNKKNGIDIKLSRNGKSFDYKSLSGGETRRMDVVIMLAFQAFLIDMSGVKCNLMVLDEIFDGLDNFGIDSVLDTVYNLFDDSQSLYVITHNNSLKSRFNNIVKVIKTDNVSEIISQ